MADFQTIIKRASEFLLKVAVAVEVEAATTSLIVEAEGIEFICESDTGSGNSNLVFRSSKLELK